MFNFDLEERSGASRRSSCSKCIAVHVSDIAILTLYLAPNLPKEQGDEEATLGMQVSPFMDRCNPQLAKLQESFINHLVAPLCNAYGEACLLPGHWVEASDSEDEGQYTRRPWKRPSQQLQPRKVSCLQTKHLQDNYEHWVNILKEENRLKEQQQQQGAAASSSSTSPRATTAPTAEEDPGVVGADVVVAAAPSPHQEEMETIQEVEEGALGGQGSTKTSPCEAASSAVRTQGGAKTLAAVDDAVVSGASHPRPLPPPPLSAGPATPGREQRSSFPTSTEEGSSRRKRPLGRST
ncbi:hypothetical protein MRX96_025578 [Rhipicephalus microplus]